MSLESFADCLIAEIGDVDLQLIVFYKGMGIVSLRHTLKIRGQGLVGHLDQKSFGGKLQRQSLIIRAISAHGYAKTSVISTIAIHDSKLHQFPDSGVIQVIIATITGIDAGLDALSVDVAGTSQQQDGLCLGLARPILVLGKVKDGLMDGRDDFFGRIVRFGVPYNVGKGIHLGIPNNIGVRVAALLRKPFRCIDTVILFQGVQHGVRLGNGERKSHIHDLPDVVVCH